MIIFLNIVCEVILMIKNDLHNRLGDIYEYSPLKYISGKGIIISEERTQNVDWELCLDVCGESH